MLSRIYCKLILPLPHFKFCNLGSLSVRLIFPRKSDTPTTSSDPGTTRAAVLGGQGSHFPKSERQDGPPLATRAADNLGSTVTGTEPSTVGSSDLSAIPVPTSPAQPTAGSGSKAPGEVDTISQGAVDTQPGYSSATHSPTTADSPTRSFPKTLRSGHGTSSNSNPDAGTAAVGETATYSSRPLPSGDPIGSVVDHQSTGKRTFTGDMATVFLASF